MDITMLKEYLGDELYARAEEKLGGVGDLQVIAAHDGSWLPRARLDQEIAKRRELQGTRRGSNRRRAARCAPRWNGWGASWKAVTAGRGCARR